jgi:hypothetical protein
MPAATTTTPTAPLCFFNRRNGVSRRADRRPIRWSSLQRRHAEQAKEQSHQRSYNYSLHQVCLPFLLSSSRDEGDPALSHLDGLVTGPSSFNNTLSLPRFHVTLPPISLRTMIPPALDRRSVIKSPARRSVGLVARANRRFVIDFDERRQNLVERVLCNQRVVQGQIVDAGVDEAVHRILRRLDDGLALDIE